MAGAERDDDAEPTDRDGAREVDGAQEVPDAEPTVAIPRDPFGGTPLDQPVDVNREPTDSADGKPAPSSPPGPGQGPAAPPPAGQPPRPPTGPSGTSVLPPVPEDAAPEPPRWAARAQVPTPRVEDYPDEWVVAAPRRGLLVPVLVTVSTMLLVGMLGFGVWLLLDNRPQPVPSPSPTSTTTQPTTTTTTATTPATTTTSATPAGIQVPPLTGEEYEDAARTLAELGLEPVREDVVSDAVPDGHVISTDPTAGTRVTPGSTIIVFVARAAEPTVSPSASPSPSANAT